MRRLKEINKKYLLVFGLVCLVAIVFRTRFMDWMSGDLLNFLIPWSEELKAGGGLPALADFPGNYGAPYMTILALLTYLPLPTEVSVRIVSFLFDFLLAVAAVLLSRELLRKKDFSEQRRKVTYFLSFAFTLLLPTVLLNSGRWAQCDSIYATFSILSLVFLVREEYGRAVLFLGASFAFKLQAVFLLPVFGAVWLFKFGRKSGRKFSGFNFLFFPIPIALLSFPAILYGMPVKRLFMVYFEQTAYYNEYLTLNFPNIYNFFPEGSDVSLFYKIGILVCLFVLLSIVVFILRKYKKLGAEEIVQISILMIMVIVSLLPAMHERYFYLGEVLILIYSVSFRRDYYLVLLSQLAIVPEYFTFGEEFDRRKLYFATVVFLVMIAIYSSRLVGQRVKCSVRAVRSS